MCVFDNSSHMCKLQKMSANLEKSENLECKGVSELWGRVEEVCSGDISDILLSLSLSPSLSPRMSLSHVFYFVNFFF